MRSRLHPCWKNRLRAKENTEELPDLDMMEQKDVIKEQEPDVDEPEMERAEKVVSITRRR